MPLCTIYHRRHSQSLTHGKDAFSSKLVAKGLNSVCMSKSISLTAVQEKFSNISSEAEWCSDFLNIAWPINPDVIQFLVKRYPGKVTPIDNNGNRYYGYYDPLRILLRNKKLDDKTSLEILILRVEARPDSAKESNDIGVLTQMYCLRLFQNKGVQFHGFIQPSF